MGYSCIPAIAGDAVETDSPVAYEWRTPADDFLQKFRDDPAFQYKTQLREPGWWQELMEWLVRHLSFSKEKKVSDSNEWWEIAVWLVIVTLFVFLIYKFILSLFHLKGRGKDVSFAGDDNIGVLPVDLESYRQLAEKALSQADYSLATRLHYLYVLHLLDEKRLIRWDIHKANRIYMYELKDERLKGMFGELCRIFEYVCYGDIQLDEPAYRQVEQYFRQFEKEVPV